MLFEGFSGTLLKVAITMVAISKIQSVEYIAGNFDCSSTYQFISNASSVFNCLSKALAEQCNYVRYEDGICEGRGKSLTIHSTGSLTWDTFRLVTPLLHLHNVAGLDKQASQSSTFQQDMYFAAAKAIDGDLTTFSVTDTGDTDPWLMVDLQRPYLISKLQFLHRSDQLNRFSSITVTI